MAWGTGPGKTGWGEAQKEGEGAQGGLGHKQIILGEEPVSAVGQGVGLQEKCRRSYSRAQQ